MSKLKSAVLLGASLLAGQALAADPKPPVAAQRPHAVAGPDGLTRDDPYYWLRDDTRKDPDMLAHIKAENAYSEQVLAPVQPLAKTLYGEIVGRLKQDDSSVPYLRGGYWYYSRFEPGGDYPILARRKGTMAAPEEILLNQNAMGAGKGYFQVGDAQVSPDGTLLAYAEDTVGRRQYVLKVKNLATGQTLTDEVANVEPNLIWAGDNKTVLYIEKDPTTLLSKRVKAHVLGAPAAADRLVYEEKDDSYYIGLMRTRSDQFVCIVSQSTISDEQRCAPAAAPAADAFKVLAPREAKFQYAGDHLNGAWTIRTNWQAQNYRLMTLKDGAPLGDRAAWREKVAHDPNVFIESFQLYDGFTVINERADGLKRLRTLDRAGKSRLVAADEPAYAMSLPSDNQLSDPDTPWVRYTYNSLTTPTITYDLNVATGERKLLKQVIPPGYDPADYVTERVWTTARDGTQVPVSLVYKKGFKKDGTAALMQYAYGAYGISTDPAFTPQMVSLADRGMVYAIAHIRGGQEMGRAWYDGGNLLNKKNSFTDFIDVTRDLVAKGYAAKGRVAANGGSAGGLLMGAVANMAPQDYRVIIAQVPFVDVVTTMLDETIPLTTNEFDEWGNPKDRTYYDYMLSYSPYDQVSAQAYPAMFVGTGLWDSQVQYYEPAKWVARLRARKTDDNPLVFRVNMEAGHGGKSGRFRRYEEASQYLAFALTQLGVTQ